MLLEKLLKEFNFSTNIFNWEEFKLFDQYFERILVSKGTFLIKEKQRGIVISFLMEYYAVGF